MNEAGNHSENPVTWPLVLIVDDTWHEIADYIKRKTGTNFSHGICPTCYNKVVKEIDES